MAPWSFDGVVSVPELLKEFDTDLRALLPALDVARNGRVVALVPARKLEGVSLLPFHLHVRWPDTLTWFPLTATVTVLPFNAADLEMALQPLYGVGEARATRNDARRARANEMRGLPGDFV